MKKAILPLSLVALLTACGGGKTETAPPAPTTAETPATPTTQPAPTEPAVDVATAEETPATTVHPLTDAAKLQKVQDELLALPQFAGKELKFFQGVNFTDIQISIDIQDPDKPENIDNYIYKWSDGKWSEPTPVQLSGGGDLEPNLTPMHDLRFADVADKFIKLYNETVEKDDLTPIEEVPSVVSYVLFVPNQDRFWQASLDTDRAKMLLRMNTDGTFREILK